MGTGTRIQFSDSDRRQICELHKAHPTLSHERLTELASRQLNKPGLKRPSITGILKESQKWLNCEHSAASNKVKHRSAKHENLEIVLMQWFGQDALSAEEFGELPGEQEVEADLTDDQLLDLLDDSSGPAEPIEEEESGDIEDHVPAPSLLVARQQLKGLATFMADNPQFTAKDEMALQATIDKVARMVVARVNHQKQQSISTYFSTV